MVAIWLPAATRGTVATHYIWPSPRRLALARIVFVFGSRFGRLGRRAARWPRITFGRSFVDLPVPVFRVGVRDHGAVTYGAIKCTDLSPLTPYPP
jgi:hypothetical protein